MARAGRPKGENNKEIICSMRMDEGTMKRLKVYCERMGVKRSEALRTAVDLLMEREEA